MTFWISFVLYQKYLVVVVNRPTWSTSIWSQIKPKPFLPQYPFLINFLTKKGYCRNKSLGFSNLAHFYTIWDTFIRFPYTAKRSWTQTIKLFDTSFKLDRISKYFFSDLEKECKLLGTKSKQTVNFSKVSVSLAPSKKYTMIEEFKDERQGFKNILNEIKETKIT